MPPPPIRCRWPPTVHRLHSRRPQMHLLRSAQLLELRLIYLVAITTCCSRTQLHMNFLLSSPFWYKKKKCKNWLWPGFFFFLNFLFFSKCLYSKSIFGGWKKKLEPEFLEFFLRFGVNRNIVLRSQLFADIFSGFWMKMFDSKNVIKNAGYSAFKTS